VILHQYSRPVKPQMLSFLAGLFTSIGPNSNVKPLTDSLSTWESKAVPDESSFRPLPSLKNAGKFEAMNDKAAEVLEFENHTYNGLQLTLQNVLLKDFMTAHMLCLGKRENIDPWTGDKDDERSLYGFTSFLKTTNWMFNGRWSTGGMTRAVAQYERGMLSASLSGQFSEDEKKTGWEADAAITRGDMCLQGKIQGPTLGISYTQPIWPNYSMGCEYFYSPLSGGSRIKWLGRRENPDGGSTSVVTYATGIGPSPSQLSFCYTRAIFKTLDVTTALDISRDTKDRITSVYKIGYNMKSENMSVKGVVDSTLKVVAMIDEPLSEAFMLQFSAKMDFPKNVYDFGVGVMMSM